MNHAKEALARFRAAAGMSELVLRFPEESACAVKARTAFGLTTASAVPPAMALEGLRHHLWTACSRPDGAASLGVRHLRQAPLVFWRGSPPAAGFGGLLDRFLGDAIARPPWTRALIEAWLRDFSPNAARFEEAGRAIVRLLTSVADPRLQPWAAAHHRFALFDAAAGPTRVASVMLNGPQDVATIGQAIGMDDPVRATGDFYRAVLLATLRLLPDALVTPRATECWARVETLLTDGGALRFDSLEMKGAVATGALKAWVTQPERAMPKGAVQSFLLRFLGDPRLRDADWQAVHESYKRVMRRWLASATLEAFFSLISGVTDDKRWEFRRDFWQACLRKAPDAEVWVVLGDKLARSARSKRDLSGSHGYLSGSEDQALLLIRVGEYVFTEWSDVGRLRAYRHDPRHSPKLYSQKRGDYVTTVLKIANSLPFPPNPMKGSGGQKDRQGLAHMGAETGHWQGAAAEFLLRHTGVRLQPADYLK